jgi:DNA primase
MDIKELLDNDGIKLTKQSHREFSGACPWCGGRDRFRVWPDENGGRFWCRGCGKGGDMVRYHMLTTGKRYFDACYDLGVRPKFEPRKPRKTKSAPSSPDRVPPPPLAWRKQAEAIVERSAEILFDRRGTKMREYLHGRGLTDRTIKLSRLGWTPTDRFFDRTEWGLPEENRPETGKPRKVWAPAGLVIPGYAGGELVRIRIRRQKQSDCRYVTVSGSGKQPMIRGHLSRVAVVESDLDGILISQEAGDLLSVIALGSAQLRPDADTHAFLKAANGILLSLDYDPAGSAQTPWWTSTYGPKVKRWPVPVGKDPGEAYQAGVDIREWIRIGIGK